MTHSTLPRPPIPSLAIHARIASAFVAPSSPARTERGTGSGAPRVAMFDAMRFIAAAGIVWVHAITPGAPTEIMHGLGTFGVPFYIIAALFFMVRGFDRDPDRSLAVYARGRFQRVYVPFLFWCAVYLAFTNAMSILSPTHPREHLHWYQLYVGTKTHLWFLPYLLVVCVLGAVLVRSVIRRPVLRRVTVGVLLALGIGAFMVPRPDWVTLDRTHPMFVQSDFWIPFFRVLPVPFLALAAALVWGRRGTIVTSTPWGLLGLVLLLSCVVLQWTCGLFTTPLDAMTHGQVMQERLLRAGSGLGCMLLATAPWTGKLLVGLGAMGRYSYGMYLSHIMILRMITFQLDRMLGDHPVAHDVAAFVLAMPATALFSYVMSRSRWTRWMMGE